MNLPRPFGPYELVRQLAVGGMAEVFVARARSVAGFEKIVALKMIHPRFSEDPEFARLLVEEANITAQLSHRNIVQVIDLGQIDGTHYIAMEYVDGLDLARLMARMKDRGQATSPRLAAFIIREVCDGLEHAHRKAGTDGKPLKIIHRDVSPPNILLSSSGEVKLTDFGIAKAALRASSTEAGVVKGKYAYMSPEQARATQVDQRTDIFAAGCVLYELATGQPVYKEAPLPILLERVTRGQFDPPERVRPDLPASLIAVIKKSLAANAADRYPTARAMAEDLNAFLYTVPPNPEFELAQLLGMLQESNRPSMPPMASSSLLDDDMDESTQIESVSVMRGRMAQPTHPPPTSAQADSDPSGGFGDEPTRALKRGTVGAASLPKPLASRPADDEAEATVSFASPSTAEPSPASPASVAVTTPPPPPRARHNSAPPTVRPGALAVAPSTVPPAGLSSGGTAKVRAPGAAGRTGNTVPPVGPGSRTANPASSGPPPPPSRVLPLQSTGAAPRPAAPPPPSGRTKTAPPVLPDAPTATSSTPARVRTGTAPPPPPTSAAPPAGPALKPRGTEPGGVSAPMQPPSPPRVASQPSPPVARAASQPSLPAVSAPPPRTSSQPMLPVVATPSPQPQASSSSVPPAYGMGGIPSVPPATIDSLPPANLSAQQPMPPAGPSSMPMAQQPMAGPGGYGAPHGGGMYPPPMQGLSSAPPGYPSYNPGPNGGMGGPAPFNPSSAPPMNWGHDVALAAAEQRQRRAVVFAGAFAALAVITLIIVLVTAR